MTHNQEETLAAYGDKIIPQFAGVSLVMAEIVPIRGTEATAKIRSVVS